jgi:histidine triad (HIT) family protein
MSGQPCIFCEIVARRAAASAVYEDERIISFMTLKATRPGECLVIPKTHIDHFTDIDDDLAGHMMVQAQRIGRRMREQFSCDRVGYVVHGYGVGHAHLIIVPQAGPTDIVSARHAVLSGGDLTFTDDHIPSTPRSILDEHAVRLTRGG